MRAVESRADSSERGTVGAQRELDGILRGVYVCYFLSGGLGLIYQILWLRKLLLVFGSTVHAVSTVLTVFFGGLALGSWLFGRLIDRRQGSGLLWYAVLEAGVGLYAFLTPFLFDAIRRVYIPIYQASEFSPTVLVGASFVCSAAILLIPTILLGGTFPVLSRFLIRADGQRGSTIASLYGINTAGAMSGTLFVYYQGLPILGLFRTLLCAGILNVAIGMLCFSFDRRLENLGFLGSPSAPTADRAAEPEVSARAVRWLFIAFGLSGFSAMVYEVAWTRALSLVVGSSTYAFCIILATFLGGIAIGSAIAQRRLRRHPGTIRQFVLIELLLGGYGLLSLLLFSRLPDWFVSLWPMLGGSFATRSSLHAALSGAVVLVPTVLMGLLFPLVSDLVTRRFAQLGQRLGTAYAINTLGGIAGSFLAGFALIPWLGLPWAIVAAALVNLVAGSILFARFGEGRAVFPRVALACVTPVGLAIFSGVVLIPSWKQQVMAAGVYLNPQSYQNVSVFQGQSNTKLLYYRDSLNATVSVHDDGQTIFLKVGGKTDASNGVDMGTQVLSAHIPLLLHKNPNSALVIGLGSGVTLGHVSRYPLTTIHCAELDPAVIEGARYFKAYNYDVHQDPRLKIYAVDGRNFLLASRRQYDVIISEPSNPWMSGLAYLFTQEFYELAKRRLAPGGVMCQWIQLYGIYPADVKLVLKTFHNAFPHVSVWSSIVGDMLLIGSTEPQQVDYQQLVARMSVPAIKESLAVVHAELPEMFLQSFWMGDPEVEQLTADVPWLHQDDQPSIEFNAPKSLYDSRMTMLNYEGIGQFRGRPQEIASGYDPSKEDAAFYRALAQFHASRDDRDQASKALESALSLDPRSSDAWMRLGELSFELRRPLTAAEAFTRAAQIDPSRVMAYRMLARLQRQEHKLDEAKRYYDQAVGLHVPDDEFAEEIGAFFMERKEPVLAAEYFRSSISLGRGSRPGVLLAYANALKELQSWETAEEVLRYGASAFPKDPGFLLVLGEIMLKQERWRDAEMAFQRAVDMAPEESEGYYGLGRVALGGGNQELAVKFLERGARYNPYHLELLKLLRRLQTPKT